MTESSGARRNVCSRRSVAYASESQLRGDGANLGRPDLLEVGDESSATWGDNLDQALENARCARRNRFGIDQTHDALGPVVEG